MNKCENLCFFLLHSYYINCIDLPERFKWDAQNILHVLKEWKRERESEREKNTKSTEIRLQHHRNQSVQNTAQQITWYNRHFATRFTRDKYIVHVTLRTKQNKNICTMKTIAMIFCFVLFCPCRLHQFHFYRMQYANVKII